MKKKWDKERKRVDLSHWFIPFISNVDRHQHYGALLLSFSFSSQLTLFFELPYIFIDR